MLNPISQHTSEAERLESRGQELEQDGQKDRAAGYFMAAVGAEMRDNALEADLARWADDGGPSL